MSPKHVFPTLYYSVRLKRHALVRALARECYIFRNLDPHGRLWSKGFYPNGYTSYSSLTNLPQRSPYFLELQKMVDKHVKKFSQFLNFDDRQGFLQMDTCWINIMGKNSHHSLHLHPLAAISGTFYLQVPPRSGQLKFEDPRLSRFMASPPQRKKIRPWNRRYVDIHPQSGQLILFESWLKHEVTLNQSAKDRVSISFNYKWQSYD